MQDGVMKNSVNDTLNTLMRKWAKYMELISKMATSSLTAEERETLTRVLGEELRKGGVSQDQGMQFRQAIEYIWTYRPLPISDLQLIKDAVSTHNPPMTIIVDNLGNSSISSEQRNDLRYALTEYLTAKGFGENYWPNELGRKLESIIDYLGHI